MADSNSNPILARAKQTSSNLGAVKLPAKMQESLDTAESFNNSLMEQQRRLMATIETSVSSSREAQASIESSNVIIQAAKDNATLAQDKAVKKAALEADTAANQSQLRKKINTTQDTILALQNQLTEYNNISPTGIGLIDRPLRKIATRKIKEDLATQMGIQQQATQTYLTNSEVIKEARSTAGELHTATTEGTAAANLAKIRAQATIDDNTTTINLAQSKTEHLQRLGNMSLRGLQITAQEYQERRALLAAADEETKSAVAKAQLDAIADEKLRVKTFSNTLNKGRILRGDPPLDEGSLLLQYEMWQKGLSHMEPSMAAAFMNGIEGTTGGDIDSSIASTLNKSVPLTQNVKNLLGEAYSNADPKDGNTPPADAYIAQVKNLVAKYGSEIKDNDEDNPFIAASNDTVAQNAQVAANPLWEKLVVARGLDVRDHSTLLDEIFKEVQEGSATVDQARDFINLMYSTAKSQVDTVNNLEQLHIPRPTGYKARVKFSDTRGKADPNNFLSGNNANPYAGIIRRFETIDLTSPADVERAFVKFLVLNPIKSITEE